METSVYYGKDDKQLCFNLRQKASVRGGFELKGKGRFNSVTGGVAYRAHAMKVLTVGPEVKDVGSKPFTLGLGAGLTDGIKEPFLAVAAKKSLSLLDGPNTVVSAKAEVDVSHTGGETLRSCLSLKLSHKVMNFTKRQDLKFTVGCDVEDLSSGAPKATPRLHLHENNWAAHYRWNKLFFTYDL